MRLHCLIPLALMAPDPLAAQIEPGTPRPTNISEEMAANAPRPKLPSKLKLCGGKGTMPCATFGDWGTQGSFSTFYRIAAKPATYDAAYVTSFYAPSRRGTGNQRPSPIITHHALAAHRFDLALADINTYIVKNPGNSQWWAIRSEIFELAGHRQQALLDLDQAIRALAAIGSVVESSEDGRDALAYLLIRRANYAMDASNPALALSIILRAQPTNSYLKLLKDAAELRYQRGAFGLDAAQAAAIDRDLASPAGQCGPEPATLTFAATSNYRPIEVARARAAFAMRCGDPVHAVEILEERFKRGLLLKSAAFASRFMDGRNGEDLLWPELYDAYRKSGQFSRGIALLQSKLDASAEESRAAGQRGWLLAQAVPADLLAQLHLEVSHFPEAASLYHRIFTQGFSGWEGRRAYVDKVAAVTRRASAAGYRLSGPAGNFAYDWASGDFQRREREALLAAEQERLRKEKEEYENSDAARRDRRRAAFETARAADPRFNQIDANIAACQSEANSELLEPQYGEFGKRLMTITGNQNQCYAARNLGLNLAYQSGNSSLIEIYSNIRFPWER